MSACTVVVGCALRVYQNFLCVKAHMSLRELVTGNDVCSPGDGEGPSNAIAGLANTLVGRYGKEQERLREVRALLT